MRPLQTVAICIALTIVASCAGPIRQAEAQMLAGAELRKFCRDQPCGATKLTAAEKLKDRWLVDFDSAKGKYTVIVEANGNAQVTVWDKSLCAGPKACEALPVFRQ